MSTMDEVRDLVDRLAQTIDKAEAEAAQRIEQGRIGELETRVAELERLCGIQRPTRPTRVTFGPS